MSDLSPDAPRAPSRGASQGHMFASKLGPLPVWGWGVLVAAVILYFVYGKKKSAGTGLVTGPSVTGAAPANVSNIPLQDVATTNTGAAGGVPTNTSWLQQGIKQGSDLGYTPLDTEIALRNYLNGTPLTQAQSNIVNKVETAQGSAPQGLGGTPSVLPNAPASTPAAPQSLGFYRPTGGTAVYQLFSDGTRRWVDAAQYAAAGKPAFQDVSRSDPIWTNYQVAGTNAPANTQ